MLKYFTHSHLALVVAVCSCVMPQCSRRHYIHLRIVAGIFLYSNVLKKLIDLKFFSLFKPWPFRFILAHSVLCHFFHHQRRKNLLIERLKYLHSCLHHQFRHALCCCPISQIQSQSFVNFSEARSSY